MRAAMARDGTPQPSVTLCRSSIIQPLWGQEGPRGTQQGAAGRRPGCCRGVEVPIHHSPAGKPIPKGCCGRAKAVPTPVLSCCTSYKFRLSLPLPPNARSSVREPGKAGDKERALRARLPVWLAASHRCLGPGSRAAGVPMDLPSRMLLACSLCLLPGKHPLPLLQQQGESNWE